MSIYSPTEHDEIFDSLKTFVFTESELDQSPIISKGSFINPFYGMKHTLESRQQMSKTRTGKKHSLITKQKMSAKRKGVPKPDGFKHNFIGGEVQLRRIKEGRHNFKQSYTCPHCGKEGKSASMFRWHFDNCKSRS